MSSLKRKNGDESPTRSTDLPSGSFPLATSSTAGPPVGDCCSRAVSVIVAFKNAEVQMFMQARDEDMAQSKKTLKGLEECLEQLQGLCETEQGDQTPGEQIHNEIRFLQQCIAMKEEQIADLELQLRGFTSADGGSNVIADLTSKIRDREDLVIAAEARQEMLKRDKEELEEVEKDLKDKLAEAADEWDLIKSMSDDKDGDISKLSNEITAKATEISDLQFRLTLVTCKMRSMAKDLALVSGETSQPTQFNPSLNDEENVFVELRDQIGFHVEYTRQREQNATSNYNELANLKVQADGCIAALESEVNRINESGSLQQDSHDFKTKLNIAESKIGELEEEVRKTKDDHKRDMETASALKEEISKMKDRHERDMEAAKTETRQETTQALKPSFDKVSEDLEKALAEIERLKGEKTETEAAKTEETSSAKKYQDYKENASKMIHEAAEEIIGPVHMYTGKKCMQYIPDSAKTIVSLQKQVGDLTELVAGASSSLSQADEASLKDTSNATLKINLSQTAYKLKLAERQRDLKSDRIIELGVEVIALEDKIRNSNWTHHWAIRRLERTLKSVERRRAVDLARQDKIINLTTQEVNRANRQAEKSEAYAMGFKTELDKQLTTFLTYQSTLNKKDREISDAQGDLVAVKKSHERSMGEKDKLLEEKDKMIEEMKAELAEAAKKALARETEFRGRRDFVVNPPSCRRSSICLEESPLDWFNCRPKSSLLRPRSRTPPRLVRTPDNFWPVLRLPVLTPVETPPPPPSAPAPAPLPAAPLPAAPLPAAPEVVSEPDILPPPAPLPVVTPVETPAAPPVAVVAVAVGPDHRVVVPPRLAWWKIALMFLTILALSASFALWSGSDQVQPDPIFSSTPIIVKRAVEAPIVRTIYPNEPGSWA